MQAFDRPYEAVGSRIVIDFWSGVCLVIGNEFTQGISIGAPVGVDQGSKLHKGAIATGHNRMDMQETASEEVGQLLLQRRIDSAVERKRQVFFHPSGELLPHIGESIGIGRLFTLSESEDKEAKVSVAKDPCTLVE